MQFPGQGKPPVGVIYQTSMSRPDAALALAMLHGLEGKREARLAAVAVTGAGLGAAQFCDAVARFYAGQGPFPDSNRVLPIGLAANGSIPPDSAMVRTVLERRNENGEPQHSTRIQEISDTAEVLALMRNALTGQADGNAVMLLSAPATHLALLLSLTGAPELIAKKVKTLIISHGPQDGSAAQQLLASWPTPVVLCDAEVGEALPFPGASIDSDFAWSPAHPVADAYRAYKPGRFDAPSWDMAAALYAVQPESGLFQLSEPGTIEVQGSSLRFRNEPGGKHRRLMVDPGQKEKIVKTYIEIASAKPVPPRRRGRPPQDATAGAPPKPPAPAAADNGKAAEGSKPSEATKPAETPKPAAP